jgi:hypothetical protein
VRPILEGIEDRSFPNPLGLTALLGAGVACVALPLLANAGLQSDITRTGSTDALGGGGPDSLSVAVGVGSHPAAGEADLRAAFAPEATALADVLFEQPLDTGLFDPAALSAPEDATPPLLAAAGATANNSAETAGGSDPTAAVAPLETGG